MRSHAAATIRHNIYRLTGERAETAHDAVDLDEVERRLRWNADQLEALLRSGFDAPMREELALHDE